MQKLYPVLHHQTRPPHLHLNPRLSERSIIMQNATAIGLQWRNDEPLSHFNEQEWHDWQSAKWRDWSSARQRIISQPFDMLTVRVTLIDANGNCEPELLHHLEVRPHLFVPMDLLSPQLLLCQRVPVSISYSIYPPLQQ